MIPAVMKILFTTIDPVEIGRGHYTHIKELVEGLEKRGIEVTILFGFDGKPEIKSSGPFIDTGARLTRNNLIKDLINQYSTMFFIRKYIEQHKNNFSLIYGRDWILGTLGNNFPIPTISEFNGVPSQLRTYKGDGLLNKLYMKLLIERENKALVNSSRIICVSDSILNNLKHKVSPDHHSKLQVIDNGVNLDSYVLDESKFKEQRIIIVFIGSFTHWHGVEFIAPTMLPILDKYKHVDLLLIGSGPYLERVKSGLAIYKNTPRVQFTGRISMKEAAEKLSRCHIGFSPHKIGVLGAPLKILEYCGAGLTQVTSGIEGTEFLDEHNLGSLVEPGNVKGYQFALEKLLNNRHLIAERGIRARLYAERYLSWDNTVDKVFHVCRDVLKNA